MLCDAVHYSSNTRPSCQLPCKTCFLGNNFTLLQDLTLLDRNLVPVLCFFLYGLALGALSGESKRLRGHQKVNLGLGCLERNSTVPYGTASSYLS